MSGELASGAVVHKYRVESVLGRGGMGVVYRASLVDGGGACALKAMHAEVAQKPQFRKRFLREARAAMAVAHPSIVRIFEVFEHDGAPMLAMELLEGESLEQCLEREGKLSTARLATLLLPVTSAVGTAHALGIVHRDIKPDNIFLPNDPKAPVRVLDFGIAKFNATEGAAAQTAALTRTGAMMGTPYYMSPEQAFGEKRIDQRADVWSLGVVMYRCLTGVLPTEGAAFGDVFKKVVNDPFPEMKSLAADVPDELAALVHRMVAKNRDDRPWDLREVHAILERYVDLATPSFGRAVEPVWEESSSNDGAKTDRREAHADTAPKSASPPLALTPRSLQPGRPITPTGTIAMNPEDHARSSATGPKPPSNPPSAAMAPARASGVTTVLVIVTVVAVAALAVALYMHFS